MIAKNYEYRGLGFPIILAEVEIKTYSGDAYPDVNSKLLQDKVFDLFISCPISLLGTHLVFIRKYMDKNQVEFAQLLGLSSHTTVGSWEAKGNSTAGLSAAHLAFLRICMASFRGRETLSTKELLQPPKELPVLSVRSLVL